MMWTIHQKAIYGLYGELFSDGQAVFPIIIPHRIVFPRSSLLCIRWLEKRHEVFLEGWNRTYQLWQDLPIFGSVVADEFQAIRENANFIAYLARLTRDGVRLDDFANGSMYRVVYTREWRKGGHQRGDPTLYQFIPRPELDREVAMAAAWIFIAGPQLVQQMDSSSRSIRVEDGYFWIKRLKEIRDF
ncbi:SubName: Full=Uncharacterized protein {ECO:0000313/EMBL:CCA67641.1} [Serendipita indica DSM 11827]|nr:SubName: Full=Uncharacterized protein {ECO:0000313/EMBL:CCA67641.1} [Serendipita indica DSM 11827]